MNQSKPRCDPAKLAELKREFDSVPTAQSQRLAPCPNCGRTLDERDKLSAGIACYDVTTLCFCDSCGYYEIGETYWTSDY